MKTGEPGGRQGKRTVVLVVVAAVVVAALVPWLGVGTASAASCTTVNAGDTITNPGCYVLEGGQPDGDEEDSDASRFVEVQASDVVIDGNGNTIDGTGSGEAVHVDDPYTNVTVRNVTLTDWSTGVYVRDIDAVTVEDVTVRSGGIGVEVDSTTNITISRVNASNNADHGVYLKGSPGGVLANVTADGNGKSDVYVENSDGVTVRDATFAGGGANGLLLAGSPNATVVRVTAENVSTDGISVDSSENVTVRDSAVRATGQHGVFVTGSTNASVVGVVAEDLTLDGIHVETSDGVAVRDSIARRTGQHGVYVADSNVDAVVRNTTATNNTDHGFRVHHSDGITLAGDTARDNGGSGIRISSELAVVRDSLLERNAVGVYLDTHTHTVENNTVRANDYGITLDADNDTIAHNRVVGSTTAGFHYRSGKDTLVYDNLFDNSNNTEYSTDPDPSNRWNVTPRAGTNVLGGSTVGGNAWFDPSGDGHSELWDDADGDGLSDTNYTVFKTSVDEHPLNAVDAALSITPASHDYGDVSLLSTATREFVVESRARPNVTVDRISVEGLDALMFLLGSDPSPVTLEIGETVAVNVTFDPTVTGLLTANLSVENDTTGVPGTNATLSGEGLDSTIPIAEAGPNRTVDDGSALSFDGTSSTDDVGIASYRWEFGDGNTTTGATPNHTYTTPGTYTVTLNVSDDAGNTDTDTLAVEVNDVTAPVVEAGPNLTVDDGSTVAFDGTNSTDDVGIVSYAWEFGDGNTTTGATANHTYASVGTYTVTLNASDGVGNTGTDTLTVEVSDVTVPVAEAGPNLTVEEDTPVAFDGTNSTDDVGVTSYEWDLGDGNTATGTTANHTYDTPGTYTVTLNATDAAGNLGTDTATVTVESSGSSDGDGGSDRGGGGGGVPIGDEPTGELTITERTLLNGSVATGEPVFVRVGLANFDLARGSTVLSLAANGSVVTEREVAVGVDGARTVYLGASFDEPGRYPLSVNGVPVGSVDVTDSPEDDPVGNGTGNGTDAESVPPTPGDPEVDVEARGTTSADVEVRNVEPNRSVPVEFGDGEPSTGDVSFESISFTPTEGEPITMNVTASDEPLAGSPTFDRPDNTSGLAHLRVEHSIANADVDGALVRFEVSAARLERLETSPDDVALYRYQNGSWAELRTRVLRETDDGYVFVARSPGLSEFAAGAKQPQFELRTADVAVERLRVGDDVRVQVRITNTGGADGTYTAKLLLDERVVSQRRLTIASNGTRQVLFSHEIERAGSYRVLVNGLHAGNVEVSDDVAGDSTDVSDAPASGSGSPLTAGAGGLLALVAVLIVNVYRRTG